MRKMNGITLVSTVFSNRVCPLIFKTLTVSGNKEKVKEKTPLYD